MTNLAWFVFGLAIGAAVGWQFRALRYARQAATEARAARQAVENLTDPDDPERGTVRFQTLAMAAVVALTAVAAILSGVAAHESDQATKRVDDVVECNQQVLEKTVQALNERTTLSSRSTRVREHRLRTQIRLVDALLDPEAKPKVQSARARAYRDAVRAQIRLDARTAQRRENHPYPSAEQIRSCS